VIYHGSYENTTVPTTVPQEVTKYNSAHGYSGTNAVVMDEPSTRLWPSSASQGTSENDWWFWQQILSGQDDNSPTFASLISSYPVVIIKTCYLSEEWMSQDDSVAAYKSHYRAIVGLMSQHPGNFFVIWNNYPAYYTGSANALRSCKFSKWAKDTLAAGLDSFGPFPGNVYVFDVFRKVADPNTGLEPVGYIIGGGDEHPSNAAVAIVTPAFVKETFDAAIAYETKKIPVVTTLAAGNVTTTGAQLNGSVNPNGIATTCRFEYGTTTAYGTSTPTQSAGSGSSAIAMNAALSALSPGSSYHYRLVATYSGGTVYGNDAAFTTTSVTPAPPSAATSGATGITSTGAQLNGSVNPNGTATTCRFEYGTTAAYGTSTPAQSAGSGSSATAVNAALSGLSPGTLYHYRIVASSTGGTASGRDTTFKTAGAAPAPPSATTSGATSITSSGAQLNGAVNPNGTATTCHFEYGTTTAYGTSTPAQSAGSGSSATSVNAVVSALSPATMYHYRLVASSAGGTANGRDTTFTTGTVPAQAPTVRTLWAGSVTSTGMQITGVVNPNGLATTCHFEYGTTTAYGTSTPGQSAGAGSVALSVNATLSGLAPGTLYHYRLVATNSGGTATGADSTASTTAASAPPPPVAITSPAAGVTTNAAQLNGILNPNGVSTSFHFEYGTTQSYGSSTPGQDAGPSTIPVPVSVTVSNLAPRVVYHYRLVATNTGGTTYGIDTTFATLPAAPRAFVLLQNYPNPFNPTTTIRYGVPVKSAVTLTVFNALGQPIATLVDAEQDAGFHEAIFDGSALASGIYFYRLQSGDYMEAKRIVLVH